MRLTTVSLLALSWTMALAHPAAAQSGDTPPRRPPPRESGDAWYGWQTLAVDAAGVGVGLAALAISSSTSVDPAHVPNDAAFVATGVYAVGSVGAPAVHWAHGRVGVGFGDMGLRLMLPPTVGLLGMLTYCGQRNFHDCAQNGMIGGVLVGEALAAGIDAALLAQDESVDEREARPRGQWYGWQTALADVAGLGVGTYVAVRSTGLNKLYAAAAGWWIVSFIAPPLVHVAHGRILIGLADAGARFIVPVLTTLFGLLGYCSTTGGLRDCALDGVLGGLGMGVVGMAVFDAIVLAREPARDAAPPPSAPTTGWAPILQPTRGGMAIGVGGAF